MIASLKQNAALLIVGIVIAVLTAWPMLILPALLFFLFAMVMDRSQLAPGRTSVQRFCYAICEVLFAVLLMITSGVILYILGIPTFGPVS
jgi:hypothetical protein